MVNQDVESPWGHPRKIVYLNGFKWLIVHIELLVVILWKINITNWTITLFNGKSTNSMGHLFPMSLCGYVSLPEV